MTIAPEMFLNPFVLIYLVVIVLSQWLFLKNETKKRAQVHKTRAEKNLPNDYLINHTELLSERREQARNQSGLLLIAVFITPLALIFIASIFPTPVEIKTGLTVTFVVIFLWLLISATDVSRAFLGGLAFKTLAAFKAPFQVGDRVSLKHVSGRVTALDTFFVTIQTPNDYTVSIPTSTLWNESLTSVNGGTRSSLCVMDFYLDPAVNADQREAAENTIWDAIQSSVYYDPTQPMQIYLKQNPTSIQLTAKAHVSLTHNEPLFCTDVTRIFLNFTARESIPLSPKE